MFGPYALAPNSWPKACMKIFTHHASPLILVYYHDLPNDNLFYDSPYKRF